MNRVQLVNIPPTLQLFYSFDAETLQRFHYAVYRNYDAYPLVLSEFMSRFDERPIIRSLTS